MNEEKVYLTLKDHVPQASLEYCFALWKNSPFELKITKTRQSKVGDFTSQRSRKPRITLNQDLNPYLFLVTYIHEVAHLHVFVRHGNRVDPHGEEWKNVFKLLMQPLLAGDMIFPTELLHILRDHMANPKASSFADADLTRAFRLFDKNASQMACLSDIPEGSIFQFQKRYFQKGKLKRTRIICKEIKSKRNYLIPAEVLVSNVQLAFGR